MFKLSPQEIQEISQIVAKIMQDTQDRHRPHVTYVAPDQEPAPCAHPLDLPPGVDPGTTSARGYYHNTANRLMMENAQLKSKVKELEGRLSAKELEGRLSAKEQALAQKRERIQELDVVCGGRQERIRELEGLCEGNNERMNQKDERIRWLEKELREYQIKVDKDSTRIAELTRSRDHWKANHDNQAAIKAAVLDRPDLGERASKVQAMQDRINELEKKIQDTTSFWSALSKICDIVTPNRSWSPAGLVAAVQGQQNICAQKEARICALEGQVKDQTNVIAQKERDIAQKELDLAASRACAFSGSFNDMQHQVYENAVAHGWHGDPPKNMVDRLGVFLSNVHAELSEAWEVVRRNHMEDSKHIFGHLAIVEELADVVIRIMDTCDAQHWGLADAILKKHEYNKTRSHRHGGKQA